MQLGSTANTGAEITANGRLDIPSLISAAGDMAKAVTITGPSEGETYRIAVENREVLLASLRPSLSRRARTVHVHSCLGSARRRSADLQDTSAPGDCSSAPEDCNHDAPAAEIHI